MKQVIEAQPTGHSETPVVPGDIGYVHGPEDTMYAGPAVIPVPEATDEAPMYTGEAVAAPAVAEIPANRRRMVIRAHRNADGSLALSGGPYEASRQAQPAAAPEAAVAEPVVEPAENIAAPEAAPLLKRPIKTVYEKDADNRKQTAAVFDVEHHNGLDVNLSEGRNTKREAIVTTESGKRFYVVPVEVEGQKMQIAYDIEKSKQEGKQMADYVMLDVDQAFSPITVGKGWELFSGTTDPVVEVSVAMHKFNASQLKKSSHAYGGKDPFEAARAELAAIPTAEPEQQAENSAIVIDEETLAPEQETTVLAVADEQETTEFEAVDTEAEQGTLRRDRIKAKMAAAAAQLKLIARNPVYGSQMVAMNTLSAVTNRENYTRRRGITAGIIGGVALATVAFLELKGVSIVGHAAEHKHGTNPHDLSNALVPAPKPNHQHDVATALTPSHHKAQHAAEAKHHLTHAHGGASHAHEAASHHQAHGHKTVTMNHTVWETAQKDMGLDHAKHLTAAQQHRIYEHTARILQQNHLSWDDARHLSKGTKLKV